MKIQHFSKMKILIFLIPGTTPGNFDINIQNCSFKKAYNKLRDFILKELESQYNEGINVCLERVQLSDSDSPHD